MITRHSTNLIEKKFQSLLKRYKVIHFILINSSTDQSILGSYVTPSFLLLTNLENKASFMKLFPLNLRNKKAR